MATAVTNQYSAKDDSQMQEGGRDISAEIADKDQILQMVDSGFDEERIFESKPYQLFMDMLSDPSLKGNQMYEKLCVRLSAFYLNNEKIRINGKMTDVQIEECRKTGFSQGYRIQLHKCLRDLMIHIVNEKNQGVKLRQLRSCYQWYINKLVAMGALSQREQESEY